ncbi:hypothetical protein H8356DRAFT_1357088 [Neocallimastix lanati (nom. inval.)]|nr:hypothetical protein H8356DRAFT_1357088 [Neocallimastix sp. JGI-2020a]
MICVTLYTYSNQTKSLYSCRLLDKEWLRKPENYDALPFYKLATRKFGPFKVIGVDDEKKNYRLDISRSPLPNMYPVFHVSELESYYKLPKSLPKDNLYPWIEEAPSTVPVSEWVNTDVIDDNPHYAELLQVIANVVNH